MVRVIVTSVALATGVLLAGCNSDEISLANNAKANQPVPPKLVADMTAIARRAKGLRKQKKSSRELIDELYDEDGLPR